MTFDEEITLVGQGEAMLDKVGNQKVEKTQRVVLCYEKSISRNEFYKAAQHAFDVLAVVDLHRAEYRGEREVVYRGERLQILKAYPHGFYVELTLVQMGGRV